MFNIIFIKIINNIFFVDINWFWLHKIVVLAIEFYNALYLFIHTIHALQKSSALVLLTT